MLPKLGPKAQNFIRQYPNRVTELDRLASAVQRVVQDALTPHDLEVHLVSVRTKSALSATAKIRRKHYGHPALQLTDQVGARVIVYYESEVNAAADAISARLDVDIKRSVDKRRSLEVRQFGYRSVHLLGRLKASDSALLPESVRKVPFEIQVRSILEHAWAEIEHEIVYKAGMKFTDAYLRRFSALAGTLELLDSHFVSLREERDSMLDELRNEFAAGRSLDERLSTTTLIAALAATRPNGVGWVKTAFTGPRLPFGTAWACCDVLRSAGVVTVNGLLKVLEEPRCAAAVKRFASAAAVSPSGVSHLALSVIAAGTKKPSALESFPDLLQDQRLRELFPRVRAA